MAEGSFRMNSLSRFEEALRLGRARISPVEVSGTVSDVTMSHYGVAGLSPFLKLGDCVRIEVGDNRHVGEVVRIDNRFATVKPFDMRGDAALGMRVRRSERLTIFPHSSWRGRSIDALCRPLDDGAPLETGEREMSLEAEAPPSLRRSRVVSPIKTGVRILDIFTPLCAGQRIGIFAGSGIGKSSLVAMLANGSGFDTVVVALVGERGREVREFIDETLAKSRQKAVLVVATGDESPMMRRLCPKAAVTIAEYFRDQGESVLLIIDSITRFAHASREVFLSAGEAPVARGYPPGVFSELPRLLERAGPGVENSGKITGVFSVLIDGDDQNDPIADAIRGTLDGHIVLDRAIADQGRFPAVNIASSISRLSRFVWTPQQSKLVAKLRALIARYEETRDLRLIGGYSPGSDAFVDRAIKLVPRIYEAMHQSLTDTCSDDAFQELARALTREDEQDAVEIPTP